MYDGEHMEDMNNYGGNRAYQARLAESLLSSLDHEEAIDFCISNEWYGVLNFIMDR